MTARWTLVGPRAPRRAVTAGEVSEPPVGIFREATRDAIRDLLVVAVFFVGFFVVIGLQAAVAYGLDQWQLLRDLYQVVLVDGRPTVIEETR